MSAVALLVTDLHAGRLRHRRDLRERLAGRSVLGHTAARAASIAAVERVILVHPPGQDPLGVLRGERFDKPVTAFAHPDVAGDAFTPRTRVARRWSLGAWRGGLGGATAWDELLPAAPLAAAMDDAQADAAVLVGGDWCCFDPAYAAALLDLHLAAPEAMKLTFTQAPPGLGVIVTSRAVLHDLARHHATFGQVLSYNPRRPSVDPIGREVCHPIPATVRDVARRFIYDSPDGIDRLKQVADRLGPAFATANAAAVTDACRAVELDQPEAVFDTLPPEVVIELTPRRGVGGPITPQHHVTLDRPDLDPALFARLAEDCAGRAVTLGGLGDAMLHPGWTDAVRALHDAGAAAICVETDLLGEPDTLTPLIDLPVDVVSVRLNADTAATYERVMGIDRFEHVIRNLQTLFDLRQARGDRASGGAVGVPWVVPRLTKTADTLPDMESFFNRWRLMSGHAVIDRPATGGSGSFALMPDRNPVPMLPPWRVPSPLQVKRRVTVLSDGTVTLCQQDWLGRAALGNVRDTPLLDCWRQAAGRSLHRCTPDDAPVCRRCFDWWSMHAEVAGKLAAGCWPLRRLVPVACCLLPLPCRPSPSSSPAPAARACPARTPRPCSASRCCATPSTTPSAPRQWIASS